MELLLFNEHHQINYFGKCKIVVNSLNKTLNATPLEQDFKVCPYIFNQEIIKQNNLLFVLASDHFLCDFILIFPKLESCNKIFDVIQKPKGIYNATVEPIESQFATFKERFFEPILREYKTNVKISLKLKQFISAFLKSIKHGERKNYLILIKDKSKKLYSEILTSMDIESITNEDGIRCNSINNKDSQTIAELNTEKRELLKRPSNSQNEKKQNSNESMDSSDENFQMEESYQAYSDDEYESEAYGDNTAGKKRKIKRFINGSLNSIIEPPNFKLLSYNEYGTLKKKLFIFPIEDKTLCYIYGWSNTENRYVCWKCDHRRKESSEHHYTAIVSKNKKRQECVKLNRSDHLCSLIKYEPEKYTFDTSKQIIYEPNFKIFNYEEFGVPKSKLVIFSKENRDLCYEYSCQGFKRKRYYYCVGCRKSRFVKATICKNDSTNENYVKLSRKEHICKMIKFDPDKYKFNEAERIVKPPNFKPFSYHQKGMSKKNLFIFTSLEKKIGYDYFHDNTNKKFFCCGCNIFKVLTTAKICKNSNGEDYVKLNKMKHVCQLRDYDPEKYINDLKIYKPDFEVIEHTVAGVTKKRLIVIVPENRELCYEMAYNQETKNYYCNYCCKNNNSIRAYVCIDENGNEFVSIYDREHICAPISYLPEKCENKQIIQKPNYQFLKRKRMGKLVEKLIIFVNDDKSFCYEYVKNSNKPSWRCCACEYQASVSVYAKVIEAKDGEEEYVELGKNPHQCEPKKYKPEDSLNIVKKTNFKLEIGKINFRKKESRRISIFNSDDTTLCYYYMCFKGDHLFRCTKCSRKKRYVSAALCKDECGEEYVKLNDNQHICSEMEKYAPLNPSFKTINLPNFHFEKSKRGYADNLVIKDWNESDLYYSYYYGADKDLYLCSKCEKKGKYVSAKLNKVENGEDYIELGPNEHVCKPKSKK